MKTINDLENALEEYCIDDDLNSILTNNGFETNFDMDDIDYNSDNYSIDLWYSTNFQVNDIENKENIFNVYIEGTAQKVISYDRWETTDCIVIKEFEVTKI